MKILGVKIDNLTRQEILKRVELFLNSKEIHQVATINPEFILQAQEDIEFKNILNNCELSVADGVGIWFAFIRFGKYLKNRCTGVDLVDEILKIADRKKLPIFLIANKNGLSTWEETKKAILNKYPNININGTVLDISDSKLEYAKLEIQNYAIVFCALGAPYQEKLMHSLKTLKNAKIRLAIGVGGSFDFLTKKIKRAPTYIQQIGLEWLWRFIQEPKYRARRIYYAIVIFPIRVLLNK